MKFEMKAIILVNGNTTDSRGFDTGVLNIRTILFMLLQQQQKNRSSHSLILWIWSLKDLFPKMFPQSAISRLFLRRKMVIKDCFFTCSNTFYSKNTSNWIKTYTNSLGIPLGVAKRWIVHITPKQSGVKHRSLANSWKKICEITDIKTSKLILTIS